jgi:hypothetical protein
MHAGFNLSLVGHDFHSYIDTGRAIYDADKALVRSKLDAFKDRHGNLVASSIISEWFPPVEANIFLSHSHNDYDQVIGLSGLIKEKLGLKSFIDSCIWGYSEDLLRIIDDEYCYQSESRTYDYKKRNRSTTHVNMMLSTALAKMIFNCECIIFVDTPNSISPENYITSDRTTDSPWIYSEIAMTSLVQKRSVREHRPEIVKSSAVNESWRADSLTIKYDVDLKHLIPLSVADLGGWIRMYEAQSPRRHALDVLYQLLKQRHHGR